MYIVIFRNYAEKHSLNWEVVQNDFRGLRINLKNPNDENWFKVSVSGKRMSLLKGWIIPIENLTVERQLEVNDQLTLLTDDERVT